MANKNDGMVPCVLLSILLVVGAVGAINAFVNSIQEHEQHMQKARMNYFSLLSQAEGEATIEVDMGHLARTNPRNLERVKISLPPEGSNLIKITGEPRIVAEIFRELNRFWIR